MFNKMKQACPKYDHKIRAIAGDCTLPSLGIGSSDRETLVENVSSPEYLLVPPKKPTPPSLFPTKKTGQHRVPSGRDGAIRREDEDRHADQRQSLPGHSGPVLRNETPQVGHLRVHRVHPVPAEGGGRAVLRAAAGLQKDDRPDGLRQRLHDGEHHANVSNAQYGQLFDEREMAPRCSIWTSVVKLDKPILEYFCAIFRKICSIRLGEVNECARLKQIFIVNWSSGGHYYSQFV